MWFSAVQCMSVAVTHFHRCNRAVNKKPCDQHMGAQRVAQYLVSSPPCFERITARAVAAYQRDGAVCIRGALRGWVDTVANGIARNLAFPGPHFESLPLLASSARFMNDYCNWRRIPEYEKFVMESPAKVMARNVMASSSSIFYHEHMLVKEPLADSPTPWHHDQPYYPIDGEQMLSMWFPVDPVPLDATLLFVKGSHMRGYYAPRKFETQLNYEGSDELPSIPSVADAPHEHEVLGWALQPGDCVLFSGKTLHGAVGNSSSSTSRRVLTTRWLGDDARFAPRKWAISPPYTGGLKAGDPMECALFPRLQ